MTDFPRGFFDRAEKDDRRFYQPTRLVTHIDHGAIAAVGALYAELRLADGDCLDLMSSWVSHFPSRPATLTVLGMNAAELDANPMADTRVVHDLNADPGLPFADNKFDAVTCCVSIDYLVRPVEVLASVARVLRPGGRVVITFSNRCFPTKAINGWLRAGDSEHVAIVERYLGLAGGFGDVTGELRTTARGADPLWAVTATAV